MFVCVCVCVLYKKMWRNVWISLATDPVSILTKLCSVCCDTSGFRFTIILRVCFHRNCVSYSHACRFILLVVVGLLDVLPEDPQSGNLFVLSLTA